MVIDTEEKAALMELVVLARKTYEMAYQAMNEVSAIRETVRALDPTFTDVLEQKRTYVRGSSLITLGEMIEQFESVFRRVNAA